MRKLLAKIGYMLLAPSLKMKAVELANGIELARSLGKFLAQASESKVPLTSGITCKMGDSDVTVLRLWATTDGNTPVNRIFELRAQITELEAEIEKLKLK